MPRRIELDPQKGAGQELSGVPKQITQLSEADAQPDSREPNIAATNRLLSILEAEADRPDAVIGRSEFPEKYQEYSLGKDGSIGRPPLNFIPDPIDDNNTYWVGLRPDHIGQVVMLQSERGAAIGRIELTMRPDTPTRAFGEREEEYLIGGAIRSSQRHVLKGELVSADTLENLGEGLLTAFDAIRQANRLQEERKTLKGRMARFIRTKVQAMTSHSEKKRLTYNKN